MKTDFSRIKNEKIINLFTEVLADFESLHDHKIILERKNLKSSTMQAQPIISLHRLFSSKRAYRIRLGYHIRNREELIMAKVPNEVLKGWFAHELGHLVDYGQHSNLRMVWFGIKYLFSSSFKRKVEHDADYIAIKYGYYDEIIATKAYILDHDLIEDSYKKKIQKYYLSLEQVEMCSTDKSILEPYLHL